MRVLAATASALALCAQAGAAPRTWPVCYPDAEAALPRTAREAAMIADARAREPDCGHELVQCQIWVATDQTGEATVWVDHASVDESRWSCSFSTDAFSAYVYAADGGFVRKGGPFP